MDSPRQHDQPYAVKTPKRGISSEAVNESDNNKDSTPRFLPGPPSSARTSNYRSKSELAATTTLNGIAPIASPRRGRNVSERSFAATLPLSPSQSICPISSPSSSSFDPNALLPSSPLHSPSLLLSTPFLAEVSSLIRSHLDTLARSRTQSKLVRMGEFYRNATVVGKWATARPQRPQPITPRNKFKQRLQRTQADESMSPIAAAAQEEKQQPQQEAADNKTNHPKIHDASQTRIRPVTSPSVTFPSTSRNRRRQNSSSPTSPSVSHHLHSKSTLSPPSARSPIRTRNSHAHSPPRSPRLRSHTPPHPLSPQFSQLWPIDFRLAQVQRIASRRAREQAQFQMEDRIKREEEYRRAMQLAREEARYQREMSRQRLIAHEHYEASRAERISKMIQMHEASSEIHRTQRIQREQHHQAASSSMSMAQKRRSESIRKSIKQHRASIEPQQNHKMQEEQSLPERVEESRRRRAWENLTANWENDAKQIARAKRAIEFHRHRQHELEEDHQRQAQQAQAAQREKQRIATEGFNQRIQAHILHLQSLQNTHRVTLAKRQRAQDRYENKPAKQHAHITEALAAEGRRKNEEKRLARLQQQQQEQEENGG